MANRAAAQHVLVVNIFLSILIPLLVLDSQPFHPLNVDWIVQPLGIWQGTWKLFAPHINTANVQLEADMVLSMSSNVTSAAVGSSPRQHLISWRSPEWSNATAAEKMRYFRWMKYYESVSKYPALYLPLAEYIITLQQDINVSSLRLYQWTQYPSLHEPPAASTGDSIKIAWTPPARQWLRTFEND